MLSCTVFCELHDQCFNHHTVFIIYSALACYLARFFVTCMINALTITLCLLQLHRLHVISHGFYYSSRACMLCRTGFCDYHYENSIPWTICRLRVSDSKELLEKYRCSDNLLESNFVCAPLATTRDWEIAVTITPIKMAVQGAIGKSRLQ